ncbi:MAG TPA: hypothetical protein VGN26_17945, partial [Armatimonadota bacterium]
HLPWLTLPGSRLVLNPNFGVTAPLPPPSVPNLPVSLAYHVGERPVALPGFLEWLPGAAGNVAEPAVDLVTTGLEGWKQSGLLAETGAEGLRLTIQSGPVTAFDRNVTLDLDRWPYLVVRVPSASAVWAAKVNALDGREDLFVQRDTGQTGVFAYDLRAVTGWHGKRTFRLRLFAVGDSGRLVTFDRLAFAGGRTPSVFRPTRTRWQPHQVVTEATDGAAEAVATVCLPDASTVSQRLRVGGGLGALTLTGAFPEGRIAWDQKRGVLRLSGTGYQAAVTFSRRARWLGVYPSRLAWLEGRSDPAVTSGTWAAAFEGLKPGDEVVVSARFSPKASGAPAPPSASPDGFRRALRRSEALWNRWLAKVPRPADFTLRQVDAKGVTPEAIRGTYYRAWVFLLGNLLPPMPENGYRFPQYSCGKPSLWPEGHPKASSSAQWESMIEMQLMALVDPTSAWDAYEGLMSLVDEQGTLGGEGLPSRHAQTAWVLYSLTGDRERLRRVYPAMKRLLLWKAADPRWIFKGSTAPGQKDSEFVVHALLDLGYARRITEALGLPAEASLWETKQRALAEDYRRWFWVEPRGLPYRLYDERSGQRGDRGGSWTLQGLSLPPEILSPSQRDSLLANLRRLWSDIPFLFPNLTKHPTYTLALRGVWRYGKPKEAVAMAETAMRDVVRAGEFAETYTQSVTPRPGGVQPSVFGAALLIDASLWHDGVSLVSSHGDPVERTEGMPGR